jgi:hypothetical protein
MKDDARKSGKMFPMQERIQDLQYLIEHPDVKLCLRCLQALADAEGFELVGRSNPHQPGVAFGRSRTPEKCAQCGQYQDAISANVLPK